MLFYPNNASQKKVPAINNLIRNSKVWQGIPQLSSSMLKSVPTHPFKWQRLPMMKPIPIQNLLQQQRWAQHDSCWLKQHSPHGQLDSDMICERCKAHLAEADIIMDKPVVAQTTAWRNSHGKTKKTRIQCAQKSIASLFPVLQKKDAPVVPMITSLIVSEDQSLCQ